MGQKVNPHGLRVGVIKDWDSRWYAKNELVGDLLVEDKKILVVPSKTVPQGIAALINFMPDASPEENMESMTEEMGRIRTGQITYAVRNTTIDGMEIHEGDIMALGDSGILAVGKTVPAAAMDAVRAIVDGETELISVYYGSDVSEEDANALLAEIKDEFAGCEIDLQYGGQPIYYYLISAE